MMQATPADIIAAYRDGLSQRDAANLFGVSDWKIRRVLADAGEPIRPRGRPRNIRLTAELPPVDVPQDCSDVERIERLTAQGCTNREIENITGLSKQTVSRVAASYWRQVSGGAR